MGICLFCLPVFGLPRSCVDPRIQGLKTIDDCPLPGSSWATNGPPPISWWSQWWSSSGAIWARCLKNLSLSDSTQPSTGEQAVILHTVLLVMCLVYWLHKIFHRQFCMYWQHRGNLLVSWWWSMFHTHKAGLILRKSCTGAPYVCAYFDAVHLELLTLVAVCVHLQRVVQMVGAVLAFTRRSDGGGQLLRESKRHSCFNKKLLQLA